MQASIKGAAFLLRCRDDVCSVTLKDRPLTRQNPNEVKKKKVQLCGFGANRDKEKYPADVHTSEI